MRVIFGGVRGSTPAPGAAFLRYGGSTSFVAIARDNHDPPLIFDGGTGLRTLTLLMGECGQLLRHLALSAQECNRLWADVKADEIDL